MDHGGGWKHSAKSGSMTTGEMIEMIWKDQSLSAEQKAQWANSLFDGDEEDDGEEFGETNNLKLKRLRSSITPGGNNPVAGGKRGANGGRCERKFVLKCDTLEIALQVVFVK